MGSRRRKTVTVKWMLNDANMLLASNLGQEQKQGVAILIERLLNHTDNYHGFNFLHWLKQGAGEWEAAGKPEDKTPYLGAEWNRVYY